MSRSAAHHRTQGRLRNGPRLVLILALLGALVQHPAALRPARAATPEILPVLARVGPWPVASRPILYRGRLWFANSVKGIDHNSADIYSLGTRSNDARYERHLWSQDAGEPAVADGLLYWPSEDSRIFGGWGEFQVTNGAGWKTGLIPIDNIFHVHAMAPAGGLLYAATSAWRGSIQVSRDRGRTWRRSYIHPESAQGISRIVSLTPLRDRLIAMLRERQGYRPILVLPDGIRTIEGWPVGKRPTQLATLNGWTYGLVKLADRTELWRTDGGRAERVHRFAASVRPYALVSGNGALWALSGKDGEGAVLRSSNGREWTTAARFAAGKAHDLLVTEETLVVTGAGGDGRGIVWGRFKSAAPSPDGPPPALPDLMPSGPSRQIDWEDAASRLDSLLLEPQSYTDIGWSIRQLVFDLFMARPPPDFFVERLQSPRASGALNPFRDVQIPDRGSIGAFWLLWGLGLGKNGAVPPDFIAEPWKIPENSAAKYFQPQIMAMWAVSEIGRAERPTIDALMARIANETDPLWLRMDAVGALSALTGAGFRGDFAAWAEWYGEWRPRPDQ